MKVFPSRGILFACAAAAALLTLSAHAQLDDLFRAPGNTPPTTQDAADAQPKASKPARQAEAPQQAAMKTAQAASPSTAPAAKAPHDKVVIYTTPTCPHCIRALKHMNDRKIAYVQKDVQHDQANRAEFKAIGGRGVPHILMGDTVMVGFSPQNFDHKYGAWRAEAGATR
jgi:glutaredoxin